MGLHFADAVFFISIDEKRNNCKGKLIIQPFLLAEFEVYSLQPHIGKGPKRQCLCLCRGYHLFTWQAMLTVCLDKISYNGFLALLSQSAVSSPQVRNHWARTKGKWRKKGICGSGWWPEGWQKASLGSLGVQMRTSLINLRRLNFILLARGNHLNCLNKGLMSNLQFRKIIPDTLEDGLNWGPELRKRDFLADCCTQHREDNESKNSFYQVPNSCVVYEYDMDISPSAPHSVWHKTWAYAIVDEWMNSRWNLLMNVVDLLWALILHLYLDLILASSKV